MSAFLSAITVIVSLFLAGRLGLQFWQRRRPHQVVWAVALLLFGVGAACQWIAEVSQWSVFTYHLWYLSGAVLTAAFLGQGTVYLQARQRVAHTTMAILLGGSIIATVLVFQAPVDMQAALAGPSVSGQGMPHAIRLLTPLFNIFGTVALVGGALRSTAYFLWNGYRVQRALGTALIAIGAFIVAAGGTLTRFQIPQALYISELLGILIIFAGFLLTDRPMVPMAHSPQTLRRRRQRIASLAVGTGVVGIFGALMLLPVLPWTMGIVKNVTHVYAETLPEKNKGVYLDTSKGVMQLYSWYVEPDSFPEDAPTLAPSNIQDIALVFKQFDTPDQYQLYEVNTHQRIGWQSTHQDGMHLILTPDSLPPGDYMLIVPTDSMFGGHTTHYFHLREQSGILLSNHTE